MDVEKSAEEFFWDILRDYMDFPLGCFDTSGLYIGIWEKAEKGLIA